MFRSFFEGPCGPFWAPMAPLGVGQFSALFHHFLEVLIPGVFFYIFVDSGPLQVPIGSPNGPIWSTFGAQIRVN